MKKIFKNIDLNFKDQWKSKLICISYYIAVFIYLELVLHFSVFKTADIRLIYPILFAAVSGGILYLICSFFHEKVNKVLGIVITLLLVIYFEVQFVFYCVFQGLMPFSYFTMGTGALTSYTEQIIHAIKTNIIPFILILLPIPAVLGLFLTKTVKTKRVKLIQIPFVAVIVAVFTTTALIILHAYNTSPSSAYAILVSTDISTTVSVQNLGLAVTTVQECRGFLNAGKDNVVFLETGLDDINSSDGPRNQNDINFTELKDMTDDEQIKCIDEYLNSISSTSQHEYTAIAKDYNIITICAEAFSPLIIDKELTPALYKLSNNGFVFKNFYNSFPNTTTNGEYTFCMGLLPNMSRSKVSSSFDDSIGNYLPYCLGNALKDSGYNTYAFHNYYGTFYDRNLSHVNMGYDFKAIGCGLDMEVGNPSSDLEMMLASIEHYINSDKPFHAYYMTYSGHYQYNWNNQMSLKNKDKVAHLPYSEEVQAYIACNLELEYALQALMQKLEEAGKADNTMIVLTGDHYPYGLTIEQYRELAGFEVDEAFEKYRNAFICYIPGMEEKTGSPAVIVNDYCSSVDILPTVLNLLGIDFDSRLLVGKDVLSDAPHIAVLSDQSFITSEFKYNATTGKATPHKGVRFDPNSVNEYNNYVKNMFRLSSAILETDYYSHVFNKTSEFVSASSVNYSDISSVYIESAVNFMVSKEYMIPDTETKFGGSRSETYLNIIDILYKMAGSPQIVNNTEYSDSMAWAISNGINDDVTWTKACITYGEIAFAMFKYAEYSGIDVNSEIDNAKIDQLCLDYPEIPRRKMVALQYCIDKQLLHSSDFSKFYGMYGDSAPRGQLAVNLQRLYFLCHKDSQTGNPSETELQTQASE
ncbi:MAG: sulfatase-like hydrolase/transferase [Clostridia bacterium]|nr:sulfatase-like hydrolase/transferase [Clostridia bacterium]